jgi:molybdopterin-guanine dinucleotide biosynthesis protein A
MKFSAAVLAGGRSSRFGSDKARFVFQGKMLMQWALDSLIDADETFIVANEAYLEFGLPVYADTFAREGPLAGIHTALSYARHDWVAVVACDMPFLTQAYWQKLFTCCSAESQAVVVQNQGRLEPLAAFYHRAALASIEASLELGQRAAHRVLDQLPTTVLSLESLGLPSRLLKNINNPADVAP